MRFRQLGPLLSEFLFPLIVLAFMLALGIATSAALWLNHQIATQAEAEFGRNAERVQNEVSRRIHQPIQGMNGLRAMYAALPRVTREQFRAHVESRDLKGEFNGVRGFGFIRHVEGPDLDAFVAAERAGGAAQFSVRQLEDKAHPDFYIIAYVEPYARNASALGLDVGSEPRRREGAVRAVESGLPTLTAKVNLVQNDRKTPGGLLFVPVFRNGTDPATPEQRRAALVGLLYAPIVYTELLEAIPDVAARRASFRLYDSPADDTQGALMYASGESGAPGDGRFSVTRTLSLPDREVLLQISSTTEFDASAASLLPWLVFAGLSLAFALTGLLLWQQATGRRRAEALAAGMTADLEQLAQVVRSTTDAVVIMDAERRITWVNSSFERLYGLAAAEVIGRRPNEVVRCQESDEGTLEQMRSAMSAGQAVSGTLTIRGRDERFYCLEIEVQPIRDAEGRLTGYMAIESDITERRQAEAAMQAMEADLRRNNVLLASVMENLPCGLSVFGADLNLVVANKDYRRLLDLPDALFEGAAPRFDDIVRHNAARGDYGAGDIEQQVKAIVDRVLSPGVRHQFERVLPNGVAVEIRGAPMPAGGFVTTYTDVSARRAAETEAKRAVRMVEDQKFALDQAAIVSISDVSGKIVYANELFSRISGYTQAELIGQDHRIVNSGLHPASYFTDLWDTISSGRVWHGEMRNLRKDGTHYWVDNTIVPLSDAEGLPLQYISIRTDITATKALEQSLLVAKSAAEEATVAKSRFLANMSHEIRTPMNAILGMLALLGRTELSARQADYTEKTEGAARALLGLLNEILDFSKIEAGKMTLDVQPFRMDTLLRDLSVILSANLGAKRLEVLYDIDPALPRSLVGDAMRLRQVLINLAGNAIKFTTGGEVTLSVAVTERGPESVTLAIAVQDTGIGIAPENQARIFSGFTQAEASTTRRFGGTGLGVALSQRLVALMGGELGLESALGQGSRFFFSVCLPVACEEPAPAAAPAPPMRALVVDDNPHAREVLERMALSLGWAVDAAESGERGLELMRDRTQAGRPYEAVFVDWQMPGLDGWETIRRMRAGGLQDSAPAVVMVTAHDREMLSSRSPDDQALLDGFLVKPVTASMLFDAVVDARCARDQSHPSRPHVAVARQRLMGVRLLVAEDNLNNQQVARELLEGEGAIVQIAGNGQQAVDALCVSATPFDVVLMDLQMPVMDGLTATRRIRTELQMARLPIVAMTANAMASDREECLAAGMNDHVGKPFDLDHLVRVIRRYVLREEAPEALPKAENDTPAAAPALADGIAGAAAAAGVEIDTALKRIGGNTGLYLRMMRMFVKELESLPAQLSGLVESGDLKSATRLLHTLKGTAATLGVSALSAEAARGEALMTACAAPAACAAAARQAGNAMTAAGPRLKALLAALDSAILPATQPAAVRAAPPDRVAALSDLRVLAGQLADADMEATNTVLGLQDRFGATLGDPFRRLDAAVGALDFETAARLCSELIAGLDSAAAESLAEEPA